VKLLSHLLHFSSGLDQICCRENP